MRVLSMADKECSQQRYHPHTGYNIRRFTRRNKLPDTLVFLHCTLSFGNELATLASCCWQIPNSKQQDMQASGVG
jgi:hypothetical protein